MSDDRFRSAIKALFREDRRFEPSDEFRLESRVRDKSTYESAARDREAWWAQCAGELEWETTWARVLDWNPPHAKWFVGGKLNAAVNCLDRHLGTRADKPAIVWEGEPEDKRTLTYRDLHGEVSRLGNALRALGVEPGDRVVIYLPPVPEAIVSMLACARIGAIHSVVFAGYSADTLRERINDLGARVIITSTIGFRHGSPIPLKKLADSALRDTPSIESMIVVRRRTSAMDEEDTLQFNPERDHWYHQLITKASEDCPPEWVDAEHVLFALHTSGAAGDPKGIVHSTGGYLTAVHATTKLVFDIQDDDVFWCTADLGWITGHSYVVYGPLSNGATIFLYEGALDHPDRDRAWQMIQKYGVTIFYTAPTAIRAFMKWGHVYPDKHDLGSLRLLGTVGEPINPEAWMWYHKWIGAERCPIVDTWWQTETGAIMIAALPGAVAARPGSVTFPFPGIDMAVLDDHGNAAKDVGHLAITSPWPSMLRGIWGDEERYKRDYWSKWDGIYFTGDGAYLDEDGYYWLLGRVDDVMNVSGHRIGTAEVESALVDHASVAEGAVVGIEHPSKGTAIVAFVIIKDSHHKELDDIRALEAKLRDHVAEKIGAIARPEKILFTTELPKTRSGKIMRRLLRDVAEGRAFGDLSSVSDPTVLAALKRQYEEIEE